MRTTVPTTETISVVRLRACSRARRSSSCFCRRRRSASRRCWFVGTWLVLRCGGVDGCQTPGSLRKPFMDRPETVLWLFARAARCSLGRLGSPPTTDPGVLGVLIAGFPSAVTDTNCWVVALGEGEQCVVIDPGIGITGPLDDLIADRRLHPVAVLLTHGHFDHTFSVLPVCQARDVPAYVHPADRRQLDDPWSGVGMPPGTPLFGTLTFAEPDDVRELADHDKIWIAGLDIVVTHAPGHSAGSVVFGLEGSDEAVLFSGDVLFAGSIGRTDLPGGSMAAMEQSLRTVILPMDDATTVHPGHGPSTAIARERVTNPYLRDLT